MREVSVVRVDARDLGGEDDGTGELWKEEPCQRWWSFIIDTLLREVLQERMMSEAQV